MTNISRHLSLVHSDQMEVARFLSKPVNSKERKLLISNIVKYGNYKHNCDALKSGKGEIVPRKRPAHTGKDTGNFLPCEKCLGFFSRKMLGRHIKSCVVECGNSPSSDNVKGKGLLARGALLLPSSDAASEGLRENVLKRMTGDQVFNALKGDPLILEFGNKLYEKHGHEPHMRKYIANQLRELGRLLLVLKDQHPLKGLKDFIEPAHYYEVVAAVKDVSGYRADTNDFSTPSLALKLGFSIKKCAQILRGQFIIHEQDLAKKAVKDFLNLMDINWTTDVSRKALRTLNTGKWNKPARLPVAKDVSTFNKFINRKQTEARVAFRDAPSPATFGDLCKVTLCHIVFFNRRRVGEVQRIRLETYVNFVADSEQNMQKDVFDTLSETEKLLVKSMKRLEVRGKRGRKVPVLLKENMVSSIDILIAKRELGGIPLENPYLFPCPGVDGYFRISDALHALAIESGVEKPENLTSTRLRKHIATLSQILNLQDNELDILANFMGHDVRVHREYYRLPEDTLQLAKVSKLLIAMGRGEGAKLKGMSLNDIDVNDNIDECSDAEEEDEDEEKDCDDVEQEVGERENVEEEVEIEKKRGGSGKQKGRKIRTSAKKSNVVKRSWTPSEKKAVFTHFCRFMQIKQVPGKADCEKFLSMNPAFSGRTWRDIKYCVYNGIKK